MDTFQIVILVVGGLLVGSNFVKLSTLKAFFTKKPVEPVSQNEAVVSIAVDPVIKEVKVSDLVKKWEDLRKVTEESNLENSVKELDEVFPTFLDLAQKKSK